MTSIRVGTAELATRKAEDFSFVSMESKSIEANDYQSLPPMVFGVFDGHGGKVAAIQGLRDVAGRLVQAGPARWTDADIADAFWDADIKLGLEGHTDGTTATLLLIEPDKAGDLLHCTLAWVGDSAAVHANLLAPTGKDALLRATTLHSPAYREEDARLRLHIKVRKLVHANWDWVIRETMAAQSMRHQIRGVARPKMTTRAWSARRRRLVLAGLAAYRQTAAAIKQVTGQEPTAEMVHLYLRIFHRELVMAVQGEARGPQDLAAMPQLRVRRSAVGKDLTDERRPSDPSTPGASGHSGSEATYSTTRRRSTIIAPRFGSHGPLSVKSSTQTDLVSAITEDQLGTKILEGPSTLVTRSIGDWDASRACIPQPEILRFYVSKGERSRIVLASDGFWDFTSHPKAAEMLHAAKSAQASADQMLHHAVARSNSKFNELKDDTTVVVVEIDRREKEERAAAAAMANPPEGGGCCAVQ